MEYTEIDIRLKEPYPFAEILIAQLNDIDFESYTEDEFGVKAYVPTHLLNKEAACDIINKVKKKTELSFTIAKIKQQNWNKKWEENFKPVHINKECIVRADFHKPVPNIKYDIIINPKMTFGTGHHETTALMMNAMFSVAFKNKAVLDVGTGTGILSILASKLGAKSVLAIDIDRVACQNASDNILLNNVINIKLKKTKVDTINDIKFDIILVNINRNIILDSLMLYSSIMHNHSEILLSGFLEEDIPLILAKSEQLDLHLVSSKNKNKWQTLHLRKA